MRADQLLVQRGLAVSRTAAQRLIAAGRLRANGLAIGKSATDLPVDAALELAPGDEDRYVSRGGLKLAGALAATGLDPNGLRCLDVGQSTGGFSDCLLQAGAGQVVGVDVGHGQLHARLRQNPGLVCLEGINARAITPDALGRWMPAAGFDLIVADVSFISLTLVLPALGALAAFDARLLVLVKPQFEVGRQGLNRHGLVRSTDLHDGVRARITDCASNCGWLARDWLDSPITGGDGNREFFLHALRAPDSRANAHPRGTSRP